MPLLSRRARVCGLFFPGTRAETGFTLAELLVVIVLIGTLAAFTIPRLADPSAFDVSGFQQEVAVGLRYAQKYAVAAGCPVRATIATNGFQLHRSSSCAAGDFSVLLQHPTRSGGYAVSAPSGITLSPGGTVTFLGNGEASTSVTISINSGAGTRQVAVVGPTGYVDIL